MMGLFQGSNLVFCILFVLVAIALWVRRVPWSAWGGPFVSIGILGTFYGILVALLGFDVRDVEASVPRLIDGMKTAFATSVVGVTVSVGTRLWDLLRPREGITSAPRSEDYLAEMRAHTEALRAIQAGIGGEGDSSLLVQMRALRLDMSDFMKKLSSQSTDAIIEALREVIKDFNAKINEQFGDNFKQLNEAVGRLVTWMAEHQTLVTQSTAQLNKALAALQSAASVLSVAGQTMALVAQEVGRIRESVQQTEQSIARVPASLEQIRAVMAGLFEDTRALGQTVTALGEAVETLTEANKTLSAAMVEWAALAQEAPEAAEAVREMVEAVRTHADAVTEQQRALIETLRAQIVKLTVELSGAQQSLMQGLRQTLNTELQTLGGGLRTAQRELLGQLQTALIASGEQNKDAINRQIAALDKALEAELTMALKLLGGKLGSLSQQFASDYGPLTEKLQKVVQLAKNVETERAGGPRHA